MINLFNILGVIGLASVTSLSGGLHPKGSAIIDKSDGGFSYTFSCDGLLNSVNLADYDDSAFANGSYLTLSNFYYWAPSYETSGKKVYRGKCLDNYRILNDFELFAPPPGNRYFAVVENFVYYKTASYRDLLAFSRQYFVFNGFGQCQFFYGIPNSYSYADDICNAMDTYDTNDPYFDWYQNFISVSDYRYFDDTIDGYDDQEMLLEIDGYFDLSILDSVNEERSKTCPYVGFSNPNPNVILHNNGSSTHVNFGIGAYRLPYMYVCAPYHDGLACNFDDFYDSFSRTWSFYFYGTYLVLAGDSDASAIEAYDAGYNAGYADGERVGYQNGWDDGYPNGYTNGREDGLSDGYEQGFADGYQDGADQDNTAYIIITGIIDVGLLPINVFLQLLNFEVFGINIGALVSSFLMVAVLLILWRTIVGGSNKND